MNSKIKVFVVDDHDVFREGIKLLLSNGNIAEVIGESRNGKEFLDTVDFSKPDVVLMDIAMPVMDGIEATKKAREMYPGLNILVLTMYGEEKYYYQMIQNGVKGFVLKSTGINELLKGIKEVSLGNFFFSSELIGKVITNLSNLTETSEDNKFDLTEREIEILKLIALGNTNNEISSQLNISTNTVRTHRANLFDKIGCSNTASLVMFAIKHNYVEIK